MSVLVKDGVQQAELHLNPAETGPVSIAITLEGTQAHVEFGADLAATRQAIENGLPALASALRDAGFTLAGGGVAQHSRSGGGQGERRSGRPRRSGRASRGGDSIAPRHGATREPPHECRRDRPLRLSRRPRGFAVLRRKTLALSPLRRGTRFR